MASCATSIALIRSFSLHSLDSPSTIIIFFSVAAMIKSISAFAISLRYGFTLKTPLMRATLTSEIISWIGISDTASAAEAARHAIASGITSASLEISVISTCTSHR